MRWLILILFIGINIQVFTQEYKEIEKPVLSGEYLDLMAKFDEQEEI